MAKLFIVSNRLPVSIQKKNGDFHLIPSSGGLATGLSSILSKGNATWLGWPGLYLHTREQRHYVTGLLQNLHMHPVYLSKNVENKYYAGFSNNTIWPLFHYYPTLAEMDESNWEAYKRANQDFCNELLTLVGDNDTVWVHDYHLFLLPKLLRDKKPNLKIGFFLHIPFPSYEIFRILPWRNELLSGVVGSDLIGFHTFDDLRHFQSAVSRILGLQHNNADIFTGDHVARVEVFPMGIDFEKFANASILPSVIRQTHRFTNMMESKKLILSVDRLDISKGIPGKLKAFETFLSQHPEYRTKCNLIMVVVPSRTQVEFYRNLKTFIEQEVGRINGKYGRLEWTPIRYMYRSVPDDMLTALYKSCEIAFITPLRDGMNLVAKEYIASKTDGKGVLILSEMAGASREMSDAIIINPNDINEMADALLKAFEMPEYEQISRNRLMQKNLRKNNIHRWADRFIGELEKTNINKPDTKNKHLQLKHAQTISEKYAAAGKRIFFLDYDGTLMNFFAKPIDAKPDKDLITLIKTLAANEKNKVVIVSGRDHQTLTEWLGDLEIDMVAEHGIWTRKKGEEWIVNPNISGQWKDFFRGVFDDFVDRTPGSFLEEKDFSLVWHYRNADPDFGDLRARELISNLEFLTSNHDLNLLEGNKVIELKPASVNKGIASTQWLKADKYSFIAAIGDDFTDEDLFSMMPAKAVTIKIGTGNTAAKHRLDSYRETRKFLWSLIEQIAVALPA